MTSSSVELAVAAFALRKGLIRVVQAAMLGAVLNNLLLVSSLTIVSHNARTPPFCHITSSRSQLD